MSTIRRHIAQRADNFRRLDLVATALEIGIVGLLLPAALPDRRDAPRRLMPIKDTVILGAFALAAVALVSGYALLVPVGATGN